jgi:hypothetical protein
VEFMSSHVTITERLLWDMLASVGRNILNLIRVTLKKEGNIYLSASSSLRVLSFLPALASAPPVLG